MVQRERREYQEELGAVRRAERRDQYLIIRMKREDNIREEKSYIKIRWRTQPWSQLRPRAALGKGYARRSPRSRMRGINDEATSQGHIQRRSSARIICGRGEGGGRQKGAPHGKWKQPVIVGSGNIIWVRSESAVLVQGGRFRGNCGQLCQYWVLCLLPGLCPRPPCPCNHPITPVPLTKITRCNKGTRNCYW